jgi:hypothetical protein
VTLRCVPALVLVAGLSACAHTRTVASDAPAEHQENHQSPPYDANAPAAHKRKRTGGGAPVAQSGGTKSENGVPLTTSRAGMLKPGAAKLIQSRLAQTGALPEDHVTGQLDGSTRAALAKFQSQHNLPPTGDPDESTIRKLGLNLAEVFVSAGQ